MIEIDEARQKVKKKDPDGIERWVWLHESLWLRNCVVCDRRQSEAKMEVKQDEERLQVRSCFSCASKYGHRYKSIAEARAQYRKDHAK